MFTPNVQSGDGTWHPLAACGTTLTSCLHMELVLTSGMWHHNVRCSMFAAHAIDTTYMVSHIES